MYEVSMLFFARKINGSLPKLLLLPTDNPYNPKNSQQWITFSTYFDPFNRPNQWMHNFLKVTCQQGCLRACSTAVQNTCTLIPVPISTPV
jgi:hypothetical protein